MINQIIQKSFMDNLSYKDTTILTYEIHYPEIVFSPYEIGKTQFNHYNRQKAIALEHYCQTELFKQAKETYEYNHAHGYPVMVYEVILNYTITYNNHNQISLYTDEYQFTGGAHGNTVRKAQNWNLSTGKWIPLSQFFPFNPYYMIDIVKQVNQQIAEQLKQNPTQYFDNYCEFVLENFKLDQYYFTPESLMVFSQQYDIAPYSSGITTFKMQTS